MHKKSRKTKEVFPFEKDDLKRIREYFRMRDKVVILSLINIGVNVALRYSDLSKLCFEHIRPNAVMSIVEQKTKKRRDFKLNKTCLQQIKVLKKYYLSKGISPTGYLFKSMKFSYVQKGEDHFLSIRSFNRYLKEVEKDLQLNYSIGSHSLRKTWGYFHYKKHKDIGIVMKILNHTSAETTLRYLGFQREAIYKVYENFII